MNKRTTTSLYILVLFALLGGLFLGLLFAPAQADSSAGIDHYCRPLFWKLGGCEPIIKCDIGTPRLQPVFDENGNQIPGRARGYCHYEPQGPEG